MSEREPHDIAKIGQWSVDRLAARLGNPPAPIADEAYGEGTMFSAPDTQQPASNDRRFIGLFPETNVVTISSKNVDVTVRNASVREARTGIHVETDDGSSRVLFLRDGHVAVEILPPTAPKPRETPPMAIPTAEQPIGLLSPLDTSQVPSMAPETVAGEQFATPQSSEQRERQPRAKFTGRLGADPHYEASQKSGLIARFPVAEQTAEEQATWHRVYSTGTRAERIRDANLAKGDKVSVDGYRQERNQKKHDGTTVKQEVIFAVHVKKLGRTEKARRSDEAPADQG